MAVIDKSFEQLILAIQEKGVWYDDPRREGVRRLQIPSYTFQHNFSDGFPAITTKQLYWRGVVAELIWFLRGDTNIKYLNDNGVSIWDKDSRKFSDDGECGRIYGAQWRNWKGLDLSRNVYYGKTVDQLVRLINRMIEMPLATDHIVTAWNPAELEHMALPPCHWSFQINVFPLTETYAGHIVDFGKEDFTEENKVWESPRYGFELVWNQRSVDTFLGLPFNIASYALLAHIIGLLTNMKPVSIKGNLNNVHLYENSMKTVEELLIRSTERHGNCELSTAVLNRDYWDKYGDKLFDLMEVDDFKLKGYSCYPALKVEMLARDK